MPLIFNTQTVRRIQIWRTLLNTLYIILYLSFLINVIFYLFLYILF